MAQTQAQYINVNLKRLANYINHLAEFIKKYNEGIKDICSKSKAETITKTEDTIRNEKEIKESYDKAMEFYNDLKRIARNYKWGMNIDYELQMFHSRFNSARLPIYERFTLRLEHSKQDEVPTGGAAGIGEVPDATEDKLQEETPKLLYGGIRYCHYTNNAEELQDNDNTCNSLNKDDTDFYAEEKEEENEGYTGDSMELAAEYKRKYDEEQEKKAEELARQQAAKQSQQIQKTKQNPQSPSENWIMPVNGKITSPYGWRIHPTLGTKSFHDGIDIGVMQNTQVKAVANGKVIKAEWYNGYGKYIEIDHGNNIISFYGHLNEYKVSKGQLIEQGQIIALSGNTAGIGANGKVMTTGAHLHFGVHKNNNKVNPLDFIRNF